MNINDIDINTINNISNKNKQQLDLIWCVNNELFRSLIKNAPNFKLSIDIMNMNIKVDKMTREERIQYIIQHDDIDKYNDYTINDYCCCFGFYLWDNTRDIVKKLMRKKMIDKK